jgi:hypothetical protein
LSPPHGDEPQSPRITRYRQKLEASAGSSKVPQTSQTLTSSGGFRVTRSQVHKARTANLHTSIPSHSKRAWLTRSRMLKTSGKVLTHNTVYQSQRPKRQASSIPKLSMRSFEIIDLTTEYASLFFST